MTSSFQPAVLSADQKEAFTALAFRYLDDSCSAEEVQQLKACLAEIAAFRELFVQICRMNGELHEIFSPLRAKLRSRQQVAPAQDECPIDLEVSESEPADPSAETAMGKVSLEDTAHPLPPPAPKDGKSKN
jgi:hypothetical protein